MHRPVHAHLALALEVRCVEHRGTGGHEDLVLERAADEVEPSVTKWTTTVGTMTIGSSDRTATFRNVKSTCGMFSMTIAFLTAAGDVRDCLPESESRHVSLEIQKGKLTSASTDPDDEVGRCITAGMGRAALGNLTCTLEAEISR